METILAQIGPASVAYWGKWILLIGGIVAIVAICLRAANITIPPIVVQIGVIVLCILLGIMAINMLSSMM